MRHSKDPIAKAILTESSNEEEKSKIRKNQRELQEQLMEMQDGNLYLKLVEERRKTIEKIEEEKLTMTKELSRAVTAHLEEASSRNFGMEDEPAPRTS